MATRMQQRRGTAATWTAANPILAAGEIGFETDTNKFKIGDGSNRWAQLTYFTADAAAAIEDLIDGAPGLLNTLNELAAAVNDDPNFFATVATNLSNHEADTTNVHGIANTANLVTLAGTQTLTNKTLTSPVINTPTGITKSDVGLSNVDNTSDVNKPVSTATQTELDLKAPLASPTFTGTVSGITKSMVGLENVDNTSDANKPVSTATQTALDLKANLTGSSFTGNVESTGQIISTNATPSSSSGSGAIVATGGLGVGGDAYIGGDLTITGDFTVNGTTTTVSTQDLIVQDPIIYIGETNTANSIDLGFVATFDDGAEQHTGLVRDASAGTWKLFKGVIDHPTTTVNFTQATLDDLAVGGLTANTLTVGDVSDTEIGYLNGVTSAIQTQLDAKVAKSGSTMTGALTLNADPVNALHAAPKQYVDAAQSAAEDYADGLAGNYDAAGSASSAQTAAETFATNAINALDSDDIEEGSTNLYHTTARAKTAAAELLTGATLSNITITGTGSGLTITAENGVADATTDDLDEGTSNKYFTDERAQDAIGNNLGTGLSYNDSTGAIYVTGNTYDAYGSASTVAGNLTTHENDTSAHGVTGSIVGTTDTQTLTNKTINSASNTITVTLSNISDITASLAEINTLDGLTANTTELNKLDGATVSTDEINRLSGIASNIQNQLDAKAALESPVLTGTPTAPTATLGTNTTQVATTAFVDAAIEALASRNLILDGGGV